MDHLVVLMLVGLTLGIIGTLIGAGGGFILVPLLLLTQPQLTPDVVTAISTAIVACNALSGSAAYIASGRVDYKAGIVFSIFTIPGSILGVYTTQYIPRHIFDLIFGVVVILLSIYLFVKGGRKKHGTQVIATGPGLTQQHITDKSGTSFLYSYDMKKGAALSLLVGYLSPILGIGGGIIHVPAMAEWLLFPVHIATATSHFVLAISTSVSTAVHAWNGDYNDPKVLKIVAGLGVGVVIGAQIGARLSKKVKDKVIVKALAVCLAIVGVRILFSGI